MNFDLCDHWVIYDPLRSEKTAIAIDRIKTVLSYGRIDISFQEISEKSVEPVLMVVKGLNLNTVYRFHDLTSKASECLLLDFIIVLLTLITQILSTNLRVVIVFQSSHSFSVMFVQRQDT